MFETVKRAGAEAQATSHPVEIPPTDAVRALKATLQGWAKDLEPRVADAPLAKEMFEDFAAVEHIAAGIKAAFGKRVADSGSWKLEGHRTPAEWMALKSGDSVAGTISMLKTADKLAELPVTARAVQEGRLSLAQAEHVASAAAAHPASEKELLEAAKTEGLSVLKERCLKVKASATDEAARYGRLHKERYLSYSTQADGGVCIQGKFTPEKAALVWSALRPIKQSLDQAARRQGIVESKRALYSDALVEAAKHLLDCSQKPNRSGPKTTVHVQIDHAALTRGHTLPGETSQVVNFGPVPVATAKELMDDAFLTAVVKDGADIKKVAHLGRNIPARLHTALVNRGLVCSVPGCVEAENLQVDHRRPVGQGGPTELANLDFLCPAHHALKTHHGYLLTGEPGGKRTWAPPKACRPERKKPPP